MKFVHMKFPEPVIDITRDKAVQYAIQSGAKWLFFLDSVPSYTPIIVRSLLTGDISIKPVSEIVQFQGVDKEYATCETYEVFVGEMLGGWSKIHHVLRHPFSGFLHRINTHSGLVDVSANHSIILSQGGFAGTSRPIMGQDIKEGMKLVSPRFYHSGRWGREKRFFFGDQELAWLYGFFAAEGSVSKEGATVSLSNTNTRHLERYAKTFNRYFNRDLAIYEDKHRKPGQQLALYKVATSGPKLAQFFASKFYTEDRLKRVPDEILNAPEFIRMAFLQGYNDGDGSRDSSWANAPLFNAFTTNSQTLAMGLLYLIQNTTGQRFSVQIRDDKPTIVQLFLNQLDSESLRQHDQYRDYREVKKIKLIPYIGYLYDIETESHVFAGGVGPILLHNSDVIPPPDVIPRLMAHDKPIVAGLYVRRWNPPFNEMLRFRTDGMPGLRPIMDGEYVPGSLVECDAVATGCVLIKTEVFERMKPFEITIDGKPGRPAWFLWTEWRLPVGASEDFSFFTRAKQQGIPVYCDTSLRCRHIGALKLLPSGNNSLQIEFMG